MKEYLLAKSNKDNIIIPLPCGADSISSKIYEKELEEADSFTNRYHSLLQNFEYQTSDIHFFEELVEKTILSTRAKLDTIIDEIEKNLNSKN